MQMSTAFKYLFNELVELHLIIKGGIKDVVDPILLVKFNVLHVLDLSLGNLVLGHARQDAGDADVVEGLDVLFTVRVVSEDNVSAAYFLELEGALEIGIAFVDYTVYDIDTIGIELLSAALETKLTSIVVWVLDLKVPSGLTLFQ